MADVIRVVIADDNDTVRIMLSRIFSRLAAFQVVGEAESGERACEVADATSPDVILMDVQMPGMGGVGSARRLAARMPSVAVIGISADESGPGVDAMRAAGVVDFVPKSASVDQLVTAIQGAVAVARIASSRCGLPLEGNETCAGG